MTRTTHDTYTAEELTKLGKRHGWRHLARLTGLSEALLRGMANGTRSVSAKSARALTTLTVDASSSPPASPSPSAPATAALRAIVEGDDEDDEDDPAPAVADSTSIQHQETILTFALANVEAAKGDPTIKWSERAALATSATQAIRNLARLRGEASLTPNQIMRAPEFTKIMAALEEALAPFGAPALKAVATALRAIEGIPST